MRRIILLLADLVVIAKGVSVSNSTATTSSSSSDASPITTPLSSPTPTLFSSTGSSSFASENSSNRSSTLTASCIEPYNVCSREGYPAYPDSYHQNPYMYAMAGGLDWPFFDYTSRQYCADVYTSQYKSWLATAPLTVTVIPEHTIVADGVQTEAVIESMLVAYTTIDPTSTITLTNEQVSIPTDAPSSAIQNRTYTDIETYLEQYGERLIVTKTTTYSVYVWEESFPEPNLLSTWSTYTAYADYPRTTVVVPATSAPLTFVGNFTYTPSGKCCAVCTLFGNDVQVYYWPTPAPSPAVSTLVNTNGFTFTSPSVYLVLKSLYATDMCGTVGSTVVETFTTIPISLGELSIATGFKWNSADYTGETPEIAPAYVKATWGDHTSCHDITTTVWQNLHWHVSEIWTSTSTQIDLTPFAITYNPCSPTVSLPSQLYSVYSAWSTCTPGVQGLYDPPYVLSAGVGLSEFGAVKSAELAVTSSASPTESPKSSTPTANPAPGSQATTPFPTSTPNPVRTTTTTGSKAPDDPIDPVSSQDPGVNDPSAATPVASSTSSSSQDPAPNEQPAKSPTTSAAIALSVITIGSSTITAGLSSEFVIDSQTLIPGSQITHSGTTLSLDPSGSALVVDGTATQLVSQVAPPTPSYIIGTQTLAPGGPAVTVSGTVLSLQAEGSSVVVNGKTTAVAFFFATSPVSTYIIGTQTLVAGDPAITVSGTVLSLQIGGSSIVVDGKTNPISSVFPTPKSAILFGSQTLKAGAPPITLSGTVVSLMEGGSSIVVGTVTQAVSAFLGNAGATTAYNGLGGVIASLGGFATPVTSSTTNSLVGSAAVEYNGYNGTTFLGGGQKITSSIWIWGFTLGGGLLAVGWLY